MKRNGIKKIYVLLAALFAGLWLAACTSSVQQSESKDDMEFTVVSEDRLPEELKEIVEEKKGSAFKLTYADEGYLYICIGYGKQDSGGYSITVDSLYETENAIYVNTNLLGPKAGSASGSSPSYPYIVIKVEFRDKTVVFD
ncbi:MAG TPA: protease complex subunit PrcB family protein [Candidatus Eisenbergiella merdipullorum]|uniref:Protease complex subunit PrcB family protein n=1 Tax=Candidatus Eisenbergiella merdipullorum TaxID=2838553 RepID=A0A9D2I383_9FIRM|nr:protease complex subunit PrcB family protein [Candidatus Eisenbergiella merdipullorum]